LGKYRGSRRKVSTILQTKNWEKGSMARRIVQFVYFQCLMYVAEVVELKKKMYVANAK